MSSTVVVSIGRNVGRYPLTPSRWQSFQDEVTAACHIGGTVLAQTTGFGYWEGEAEHTAIWTVLTDSPLILRWDVERIARTYSQDAIGFVVHDADTYGDSAWPVAK